MNVKDEDNEWIFIECARQVMDKMKKMTREKSSAWILTSDIFITYKSLKNAENAISTRYILVESCSTRGVTYVRRNDMKLWDMIA